MSTHPAEQELLALEREYWQAVVNKDERTAVRLTHDPCVIAGPNGVRTVSHDQLAATMRSSPLQIDTFSIGNDAVVRFVGGDVAVVAYSVHEDLTRGGGAAESLDAVDTSTWIRQDGRWVCAAHTESIRNHQPGRASSNGGGTVEDTVAEIREGLEQLRFGSSVSPAMPDRVGEDRDT
jgi:ketosteroid isomerase-like protein